MRGAAGLYLLCISTLAVLGQTAPDFRRDVEPLLTRRCTPCHNASLSQNGVRFDDREAALAGGYSGPVIVREALRPRLPEAVLTRPKNGFRMPPAGPPLTPAEIAVLRAWIQNGAAWPQDPKKTQPSAQPAAPSQTHWSFRPVVRPPLPDVTLRSWVRNPVDRFVLARL